MTTTTVPTAAQIAQVLERGARIAAPVIALLITCLALLVELSYELGRQAGAAVHARNDQLAALWRRLLLGSTPAAPVAPVAPVPHPLAALAAELQGCTSTELRRITRSRRRCSKAALIAEGLALAI